MQLYCVKPYEMPGGVLIVSESAERALALMRFLAHDSEHTRKRPRTYREDVQPFLEALPMGVEADGPERVVCVLKGLIEFKPAHHTLFRSRSETSSSLATELPGPPMAGLLPVKL